MSKPEHNHDKPERKNGKPNREILNAKLFAGDIVYSDTEQILFEEDLQEDDATGHESLMQGDPERRYSVVRKLNSGGMKAIWEVDDHRTARKVAMAQIQDSKIASREDIEAFLYEARLTANLQHPNIVPIYDIALDEGGNPYFTMKALKGESLGAILRKLRSGDADCARRFSRTRLLSTFLKVCDAIAYVHSKGVIHLDLKPANVVVGDYGDVYVLDWGLSVLSTRSGEGGTAWHGGDGVALEDGQPLTRFLEHSSEERRRHKVVGGTPGYMAPEQAQGAPNRIDFRTDVYMLGALLYEILTHHCPIEGEPDEALRKTVRGEIVPPGRRNPQLKIPAALGAIAMKALSTEPEHRYPNVGALIRDVQQYQEGFATQAENPTFLTHLALLVKRHKLAVGLVAAFALATVAVVWQSVAKIKRSERVAVAALAELRQKNDYIAAMARKVAPDYLDLMASNEKEYAFDDAEQALDTGLEFDPSLKIGWMWKGKMLLCQQRFHEGWEILSGQAGHPVQHDAEAIALAETYKDSGPVPDAAIPQLVRDFRTHNVVGGIPRLFYHLNRKSFDPATRFPALAESLRTLNPRIDKLKFAWKAATGGGWDIDLSGNPALDDISPLCGLDIRSLDLGGDGVPDLRLIEGSKLKTLMLSGSRIGTLPELDKFAMLETLDISRTQIRNIAGIVRYPNLAALDIGGIEGLAIPPQLVLCRNLRTLTVAERLKNDSTLRALARRGVILIYGDQ